MKAVSLPPQSELDAKAVYLPKTRHQKTLIFDLDETLVHCVDDPDNRPYDKKIAVTF